MRIKGRFYVILTLLILILLGIGVITLPFFQVRYIEVRGTGRLTEQEVDNLGLMVKGKNLFLTDRKQLKQAVEEDPYLALEKIRYGLPNRLVLQVKERKAEYYLTHLGSCVTVSKDGVVVNAESGQTPTDIPEAAGIRLDAYTIGQGIQSEDQDRLDILSEILAKFEESGMLERMAKVDMTNVMHIAMTTREGYAISFGSRENIERKIEWIYTILNQLSDKEFQSCTIDVSTAESPTYKIEK